MTADHPWSEFHRRWPMLRPPQRATPEVSTAIGDAIAGHDHRVLLLGVTPELSGIGRDLTAVDWSEMMIGAIWPGNGPGRRAVLADWRDMAAPLTPFSAVIGD